MRQAYSVQQASGLLGTTPEVVRQLTRTVLGEPRDVLSRHDLDLLREANEGTESYSGGSRGGVATTLDVQGRRWTVDTGQGLFDFGAVADRAPSPSATPSSEALFTHAVQLEADAPLDALGAYAEALAADPRHADAHINRGRLLHQRGELQEAEAHYVAALVLRPTDTTATFNLAVVLEDLGRIDEAIARYHETIELDGRCVDAYFNLARLYELKGETMAAIRHFKDYRRLLTRSS